MARVFRTAPFRASGRAARGMSVGVQSRVFATASGGAQQADGDPILPISFPRLLCRKRPLHVCGSRLLLLPTMGARDVICARAGISFGTTLRACGGRTAGARLQKV